MFWSLFWLNNFFKMINLFAIFASEDGKQLLSCLYVAIFLFCAEKCPKDPEDTEVGELCGSTPPHPVRCPVYNWRFSHHSTPIHWLVYGRMTSNNETVSRQMPWVGNIAKTMTSNGKQFTVTHKMLTAVAHDQRWPDVVTGISAHFSKCFPQLRLRKHWDSQETKFTVPLGTSH